LSSIARTHPPAPFFKPNRLNGTDAAMLFRIVNDRHKRKRLIIFATN
jgi:hypothetical protein